mmetsp:Transcript_24769/g.62046  ORF Transcript_24769/g.62046 Transcript_24769/m.62046 type:complete len:266 (-) Transcript_24769:825-1622(-)
MGRQQARWWPQPTRPHRQQQRRGRWHHWQRWLDGGSCQEQGSDCRLGRVLNQSRNNRRAIWGFHHAWLPQARRKLERRLCGIPAWLLRQPCGWAAAAAAAAVAAPARCGSSRSHGWGATRTRCSVQLWPCSACPAVTATDTASSIAQARLGEVHVGLATEPLPRGMRQAVLLCERMSILPLVRRETRRQGGLLGVGLAQESLELPPDKIEFLLGQKSLKFAASQQGLRLLCLHVRPPPAEPRPRAQRLERRLRGLWRGIPHEGCA